MQDAGSNLDENFRTCLLEGGLPPRRSQYTLEDSSLSKVELIELFESQLMSRHLDLCARDLKQRGQSFYTIGSSGHEGSAAIAKAFRPSDMAFLHYRSAAFMIQRLEQSGYTATLQDLALSFTAAKADPIAQGRHKVLGSATFTMPPQTSTIASHLPKAVGTALSIHRAQELGFNSILPHDSVVVCSFGDASVNHASAQTAFNAAAWLTKQGYSLPIVFVCEDNGIGISTVTINNWIEESLGTRTELQYIKADGLDLIDTYRAAKQAETLARTQHKPVLLHMKCVRLMGHAGTDIEEQYRSIDDILSDQNKDPLRHSARLLMDLNIFSASDILQRYDRMSLKVSEAAQSAVRQPKLSSASEVMSSIVPPPRDKSISSNVCDTIRKKVFTNVYPQLALKRNLCQHVNFALTDLMLSHEEILIFGEDVAKKGGVYGVTRELAARFGKKRVFDTLLDETMILGSAIGFAHNGFLPIPEIQFLAYLHNAEDQIRGEAATLSFFSSGQYTNPMVIRVPSFGYQKGFGGHFHNDNSLSILRDIPGLIVAAPSRPEDASRLLRKCVQLALSEQRVVVFLEPIALYMTKDWYVLGDQAWLSEYPSPSEDLEFSEVGVHGAGEDLTIVSYANGFYLATRAAKRLKDEYNITTKIIDLRWLSPLPESSLLKALSGAERVLVVDECRQSGSLSEAILTLFVERLQPLPSLKRLTAKDSFIPLGPSWQFILPSEDDIINTARELMNDL